MKHISKAALRAGIAVGLAMTGAGTVRASDLILLNGKVYTAADRGKWAEAVAITGDKIEAVGSAADVLKTKTAKTKMVDLKGRMVIPGITDNHTHIWFGSLALTNLNLSTPESNINDTTPELFVAKLKAYAAAHKAQPLLFARAAFTKRPSPPIALLDEAVPDKPLIVHHTGEHALFVNSKALALAGITDKPLADPVEESYVERDASGRPTGVLREAAQETLERALPKMSMDEQVRVLKAGEEYLNSFGITSAVALTGGLEDLRAYDTLRKRGMLTLRIRQAFAAVAVNQQLTPQFLADLETARTTWHDDWLSANIVKFFMDGSSSPATGPLYKAEDYTAIITELDKRGYSLTSHALTAEGLKMALDGYESVQRTNGKRDQRFRIEHGGNIAPEDLPRFAQMGVLISTQPAFCCSATTPSNPWKSLWDSGVPLVFSSDWPCSWPPSPALGIEQAIKRWVRPKVGPNGPEGEKTSDGSPETLTAEQALLAYTRNAAYANRMEAKLGTLEAGKLADLAVLEQNILEMAPEAIGTTKVTATMVGGKIVYGTLP